MISAADHVSSSVLGSPTAVFSEPPGFKIAMLVVNMAASSSASHHHHFSPRTPSSLSSTFPSDAISSPNPSST
jgi:hypothetical protein